jgi:large subunit ribosomal protein L19e
MNLSGQRRLAADILDVGENRIWIDPDRIEEVDMAITRQEIRNLIRRGVIKAKLEEGQSHGRTRILKRKKRSGRRIGPGTKKGSKYAVVSRKERWMNRIRALRKKLKDLRERRIITVSTYRVLYRKAKGGEFQSVSDLERYINENNLRRRTFG